MVSEAAEHETAAATATAAADVRSWQIVLQNYFECLSEQH